MICQGCGKQIDVTRKKWCSKECQGRHRRPYMPPRSSGRACVCCGIELQRKQARYCSVKCKNKMNNSNSRVLAAMAFRFCPCGAYLPMATHPTVTYCPVCSVKDVYGDEGGNGVDLERFRRIAR